MTAARWNPDQWAKLFADVGAKYVVLTAEQHDGWVAHWKEWNESSQPPRWGAGERGGAYQYADHEWLKGTPHYTAKAN